MNVELHTRCNGNLRIFRQVKFKRRSEVHDKARERCAKFFIRLQQIGAEWIYLGATKTGMVYRLKGNPPQSHE